jgi:hypothetical protein
LVKKGNPFEIFGYNSIILKRENMKVLNVVGNVFIGSLMLLIVSAMVFAIIQTAQGNVYNPF